MNLNGGEVELCWIDETWMHRSCALRRNVFLDALRREFAGRRASQRRSHAERGNDNFYLNFYDRVEHVLEATLPGSRRHGLLRSGWVGERDRVGRRSCRGRSSPAERRPLRSCFSASGIA
jgi:hypothetical protein